jgi:sulfate adenylyltransferase
MANLIPPHGGKGLTCCLLEGPELDAEKKKAEGLKKISVSPREKGDLIMMGIGGFSPLTGFMTKADWKGVCDNFLMADGTFWPIPVTLSATKDDAAGISEGDERAKAQRLQKNSGKYPKTIIRVFRWSWSKKMST